MAETKHAVTINRKIKRSTREEWEGLEKSELIDHILRLEAHNFQLKNLLQKKLCESKPKQPRDEPNQSETNGKKTTKRSFDFSRVHKRHVLLKILYFGWDYQGFASQENSNDTIEYHLFDGLTRTCLIESRATSNYHRCGRTDKSVSAFCQVVSLDLRSKFPEAEQLNADAISKEIDYCGVLNRVLPDNIQCISWMPLETPTYSARFDCVARTYRYYFPRGSLDIQAMREACKRLERHADFRNFCKMDVANGVTNFMRNVKRATINVCDNEAENITDYTMFYLEITSNAFLFHQIRCIMTVLFLIGQGKENATVIDEMLDVEKNPCKPQYSPACGVPLNLFRCEYNNLEGESSLEESKLHWVHDREALLKLIEDLQTQWTFSCVKTTMIRDVIQQLLKSLEEQNLDAPRTQVFALQDAKKPRQYQKLLHRKRCESLENRIDHFVKKQRLVPISSKETNSSEM